MESQNFITELFVERSQKLAGISLVRKAFLELGYEFWEQGTFDFLLDLSEIRCWCCHFFYLTIEH